MRADAPIAPTGQAILAVLVDVLTEMTEEWDLDAAGSIGAETWFVGDLGFTSMDLVMLVVELKARYDGTDLPFEDLFAPDGEYVSDLRVGDMASFLAAQLAARPASGPNPEVA